jgi:hypothetical protein
MRPAFTTDPLELDEFAGERVRLTQEAFDEAAAAIELAGEANPRSDFLLVAAVMRFAGIGSVTGLRTRLWRSSLSKNA